MPDETWSPGATEAEKDAINKLVADSGLPRDFVVWYLATSGVTAAKFLAQFGDKAGKQLQSVRQNEYWDRGYNAWQLERAAKQKPTKEEAAEAGFFGILPDPKTDPFGYMSAKVAQLTEIEANILGMTVPEYQQYLRAGGERPAVGPEQVWPGEEPVAPGATGAKVPGAAGAEMSSAAGAFSGAVGEVFSGLTPEQLDDLGAEQISEKFGLQRLAVEEPEAFLQAMFDKAGITPSPPIYAFLRDMMPSIVLLASTREGQDILKSPGGAVELNKAINEVISQGFPSRESVMGGLQGMGGFARELLGGGYESGRGQFNFVMGTLDALIGPTMAEPLRRALFSNQAASLQGDRFLSASARGIFTGDFVDWLKQQGYPIPELPAYKATPGAVAGTAAAAAPFVEEGLATKPGSAPFFPVAGGTYE